MTTVAIRPKLADRSSMGAVIERMLDWPDGAIAACQRFPGDPWQFTFRADVLRMKRQRMEQNLRDKRESDVVCRRALYVWVFFCPGIFGFAYRGWWTYLVGIGGKRYWGGGVNGNADGDLQGRIMQIFPVPSPHPLLGPVSFRGWMPLFAEKYQRGLWCGKPQGKAAVWATVQRERVLEILDAPPPRRRS